jgi:hypothetical protein
VSHEVGSESSRTRSRTASRSRNWGSAWNSLLLSGQKALIHVSNLFLILKTQTGCSNLNLALFLNPRKPKSARDHSRIRRILLPCSVVCGHMAPLPSTADKVCGWCLLSFVQLPLIPSRSWTGAQDTIISTASPLFPFWSLRSVQLPERTLGERGYHIAPVLNAPKLQTLISFRSLYIRSRKPPSGTPPVP